MNKTLKDKIKYVRTLFILSTDDISIWEKKYSTEYRTKYFNNNRFTINTSNGRIYLSDMIIANYKLECLKLNFKLYFAVRKIVKHFKQIEKDETVRAEINFVENGIKDIEPNFVKKIRKTKLKELEK